MNAPEVSKLNDSMAAARKALKPESTPKLMGATVKSAHFYHNSVSRHNAIVFTLEDGTEVFKALRETEDFMRTAGVFVSARAVTVWYDDNNVVQQFVLSHDFG